LAKLNLYETPNIIIGKKIKIECRFDVAFGVMPAVEESACIHQVLVSVFLLSILIMVLTGQNMYTNDQQCHSFQH